MMENEHSRSSPQVDMAGKQGTLDILGARSRGLALAVRDARAITESPSGDMAVVQQHLETLQSAALSLQHTSKLCEFVRSGPVDVIQLDTTASVILSHCELLRLRIAAGGHIGTASTSPTADVRTLIQKAIGLFSSKAILQALHIEAKFFLDPCSQLLQVVEETIRAIVRVVQSSDDSRNRSQAALAASDLRNCVIVQMQTGIHRAYNLVACGTDSVAVERGVEASVGLLLLALRATALADEVSTVQMLYADLATPPPGDSASPPVEKRQAVGGGGDTSAASKELVAAAVTAVQSPPPRHSMAQLLNCLLESDRPLPTGTAGAPPSLASRVRRMSRRAKDAGALAALRCVNAAARVAPRLLGKRLLGVVVSQAAMSTSRGLGYTMVAWEAACGLAAAGAGGSSMHDLLALGERAAVAPFFDAVEVPIGKNAAGTGDAEAVRVLVAKPRLPLSGERTARHLRACLVPLMAAAVAAVEASSASTATKPLAGSSSTTMSVAAPSTALAEPRTDGPPGAAASSARQDFAALQHSLIDLCLDATGALSGSILAAAVSKSRAGAQVYLDAMHSATCSAAGLGQESRDRASDAAALRLLRGATATSLAVLRSCQEELAGILRAGLGLSGGRAEVVEDAMQEYVRGRAAALGELGHAGPADAVRRAVLTALRVPALAMGAAAFEEAWGAGVPGGEAGGAGAIGRWQEVMGASTRADGDVLS